MKNMKLALVFVGFLSACVFASPPVEKRLEVTQPNGEQIVLTRRGNASLHWLELRRGAIVVLNKKSGYYEYAKMERADGRWQLLPSGFTVGKNSTLPENFQILKSKDLIPLRKQISR